MKFSEFKVGQRYETASVTLSKEDIMRFAEMYDPQYMHLDEEKAKKGRFGGLIASGMQTLNVSFRLWIDVGIYGEHIIAGTGMNQLQFLKPVYPGDELHVIAEVIELRPRRAGNGTVTVLLSTYNQKGQNVFRAELSALVDN
ncbi:MaoC family dehydratase [Paenibacillus barcinonensis]|uniref:MaoC family dehydratase n=1 Tax=Paenibacillus TaxID=44249 RepID=UPI001C10A311|nr:MaoC family dehydratase [Paenibacillus barcinonensis]MBU5351481.1 MaoC family dehydratase [Paenibacillus barcinonensis]